MRVERHKSGVWVREDGCVYVPQNYRSPAHWTFGCKRRDGYRVVTLAGKIYLVHRLVAETYFGDIPDGTEVDHANRNRSDNRVENLRIVTHSENLRNTVANDRIDSRGGTHHYEDARKAHSECKARYYAENKGKILEQKSHSYQAKRKTHRPVRFADGIARWIPNEEAEVFLLIPLKERYYGK